MNVKPNNKMEINSRKLTLYDLKRMQIDLYLLNATVGLQDDTMKDVSRKIKEEIDKIKSES